MTRPLCSSSQPKFSVCKEWCSLFRGCIPLTLLVLSLQFGCCSAQSSSSSSSSLEATATIESRPQPSQSQQQPPLLRIMRSIGQGWCLPTSSYEDGARTHTLCIEDGDPLGTDQHRETVCFRHGINWFLDAFGTETTTTTSTRELHGIAVHEGPGNQYCSLDHIFCVVYFSVSTSSSPTTTSASTTPTSRTASNYFSGTDGYPYHECFVLDTATTTATTDPSSCTGPADDCGERIPSPPPAGSFWGGKLGDIDQPCFPQKGCTNHLDTCSTENWYELSCTSTSAGYYLVGDRSIQCQKQPRCAVSGIDCIDIDIDIHVGIEGKHGRGYLKCLEVQHPSHYLDVTNGIVMACQTQPNCMESDRFYRCSIYIPNQISCKVPIDGYYLRNDIVAGPCTDLGCPPFSSCEIGSQVDDVTCSCFDGYCRSSSAVLSNQQQEGSGQEDGEEICEEALREEGCFEYGECDASRPGYLECLVPCMEQTEGCSVHGTSCSDISDHLVCVTPEEGYYIDNDGMVVPCTDQEACETSGTTCSIDQPTKLSCLTPTWGYSLERGDIVVPMVVDDDGFCTKLNDGISHYCIEDGVPSTTLWEVADHDSHGRTNNECQRACADYIQRNNELSGGCCTWRVRMNGYDWTSDVCTFYNGSDHKDDEVPYGTKVSFLCGQPPPPPANNDDSNNSATATSTTKTQPTEFERGSNPNEHDDNNPASGAATTKTQQETDQVSSERGSNLKEQEPSKESSQSTPASSSRTHPNEDSPSKESNSSSIPGSSTPTNDGGGDSALNAGNSVDIVSLEEALEQSSSAPASGTIMVCNNLLLILCALVLG